MRVWNLAGLNGKNFEERFPGFAAWRAQHKGVATDVTLGKDLRGTGPAIRGKRKRKGADKE
jgi:hypothetical protein